MIFDTWMAPDIRLKKKRLGSGPGPRPKPKKFLGLKNLRKFK